MLHVPSLCLLHTWNDDCAVLDIYVLSSTFEITQLAVEKVENMITNYIVSAQALFIACHLIAGTAAGPCIG